MNVLLRKFTATASLSTDEASEEIRHGAVKCLKALVGGLTKCGRASCNCHSNVLPTHIILGDGGLKVDLISTTENTLKQRKEETVDEHDECLIEFLQSETMSIAVGHLLSLLLQVCTYFLAPITYMLLVCGLFYFKYVTISLHL